MGTNGIETLIIAGDQKLSIGLASKLEVYGYKPPVVKECFSAGLDEIKTCMPRYDLIILTEQMPQNAYSLQIINDCMKRWENIQRELVRTDEKRETLESDLDQIDKTILENTDIQAGKKIIEELVNKLKGKQSRQKIAVFYVYNKNQKIALKIAKITQGIIPFCWAEVGFTENDFFYSVNFLMTIIQSNQRINFVI